MGFAPNQPEMLQVQRQTSLCWRQAWATARAEAGAGALCVLAQGQSCHGADTFSFSAHSPPTPRGGCPAPGSAGHRGAGTADWPLGWGKMFLWSLGKPFCPTARKAATSHVLCQGCALSCRGAVGSQPGAVCPSATTQLHCSSTDTQPRAPPAGCGSIAGAAPL